MRAIIGIGNPGGRYQLTRHNVGFMLIDYLAEQYGLILNPSRHDYYFAEGSYEDNPFVLIKPTTFVNNSGSAIAQFQQQYKMRSQDMLVVYDDLNIPLSEVRIRFGGSHGGHNGIYSLIYHLNTNQFPRLRMGIGSSFEKGKMTQFVLGKLNFEEFKKMQMAFEYSNELFRAFIGGGLKNMLDINSKLKDPGNVAPDAPTEGSAEPAVEQTQTEQEKPDSAEENEQNFNN